MDCIKYKGESLNGYNDNSCVRFEGFSELCWFCILFVFMINMGDYVFVVFELINGVL